MPERAWASATAPDQAVSDVQNFADLFRTWCATDRPYLVELHHGRSTTRQWTARNWGHHVESVAAGLRERGGGPGTTIATLAGNTAGALAVSHACWLLGASVMPLNPGDTSERLSFILSDAEPILLVCCEELSDQGRFVAGSVSVVLDSDLASSESGGTDPGGGNGALDAEALRIYTSGTTGAPKAVSLTMRNLLAHTGSLSQALGWDANDRVLTVLPIHHVNGLLISCLLPLSLGASTVLCDRFRSDHFWKDVETHGATVCSVVPSLLEFLLSAGKPGRAGLREILCGAGPLLPETVCRFEDEFGIMVRHLYGLSETTAVATLMPVLKAEKRRELYKNYGFPSVGCPVPGVEVAVLDGEVELGPSVRGQLAVKGPTVMKGYVSQAAAESPFTNGWFLTGDQGFWEQDGDDRYFFITGRTKELIIRGGVNLSPVEIDGAIMSHPAVQFGLAICFENRFYGEEVAAYVVRSEPVSEEEIIEHCVARLGFERSPKIVIFGDDVPFTATGKAKRFELRQRLAEELKAYRGVQFRRTDRPQAPHSSNAQRTAITAGAGETDGYQEHRD